MSTARNERPARRRRAALGALALLVTTVGAAACSSDDEPGAGTDVSEALEGLRVLVEGTADAVTATGELEVLSDSGPAPCQSSQTGAVTDEEQATLTVAIPVGVDDEVIVLDELAAFWETEGLEVDTQRLDSREPEVLGRGEVLSLSALAIPGTGQVSIMGTTDCLEAAGA